MEGGLKQIMQSAGASSEEAEDLSGELETVASMPGGIEMLFTRAAEKAKGGRVPVRLYSHGEGYEGGGLAQAAESVRAGGRGRDDILLHVSPEEFEGLQAMWGPADINPETGMPEYGWLSKKWKKLKKAVKKIVKSPIFQAIAPIALNFIAPGLGAGIGAALGASGSAAGMVGNAVIGGALGAAKGEGVRGIATGALAGAGSAGLGAKVGSTLGLSGKVADIGGNALLQGAGSKIAGGDFVTGAITGGLTSAARPLIEKGLAGLTGRPVPTGGGASADQVQAGVMPGVQHIDPITGRPIGQPGDAVLNAPSGNRSLLGSAIDNAPKILGGLSLVNSLSGAGAGETVEGDGAPELPSSMTTPLPQLDFKRSPFNGPLNYYTYGRQGPSQNEANFFTDNTLPSAAPAVGQDQFNPQDPSRDPRFGAAELAKVWPIPGRFAEGQYVRGEGSGRDDLIPASLSDGEYVMDAETVSLLGDGSSDEGARRLDQLRENIRRHKGQQLSKGKFSHDAKTAEEYLAPGGRIRRKRGGRMRKKSDDSMAIVEAMASAMQGGK